MNSVTMNRLLVRMGAPDAAIQGEQWQLLIQQIYRLMVKVYDPAVDWLFPDYKQAASDLLDTLDVEPEHRLLDLGCGTGLVTLPAAQRARFVAGIDLTAAMLDRQRRKIACSTQLSPALMRGDVRFLPLFDGSFDRVTTSFMLLHLTGDEKRQTFNEVARVLVSGGRFGCLTGMHEIAQVYPTPEEWRQWLAEAGFVDVQVQACYGAFRIVAGKKE